MLPFLTPVKGYTYNGILSGQDEGQWYKLNATSGQLIDIDLTVPVGADFDLWLATSTGLEENQAHRHVPLDYEVAHSTSTGDSAEDIDYTAEDTRSYYLYVHSHEGSGGYTLDSNVELAEYTPPGIDMTFIIIIVVIVIAVIAVVVIVAVKARSSTSRGYKVQGYAPKKEEKRHGEYTYRNGVPVSQPSRTRQGGMFEELEDSSKPSGLEAPYNVSSAPIMDKKKFCPNCGAEWESDAVFCGDCGHKFES